MSNGSISYGGPIGCAMCRLPCDNVHATIDDVDATIDDVDVTIDNADVIYDVTFRSAGLCWCVPRVKPSPRETQQWTVRK